MPDNIDAVDPAEQFGGTVGGAIVNNKNIAVMIEPDGGENRLYGLNLVVDGDNYKISHGRYRLWQFRI